MAPLAVKVFFFEVLALYSLSFSLKRKKTPGLHCPSAGQAPRNFVCPREREKEQKRESALMWPFGLAKAQSVSLIYINIKEYTKII